MRGPLHLPGTRGGFSSKKAEGKETRVWVVSAFALEISAQGDFS